MAEQRYKLIRSAPADSDIAAIRDYTVKTHGREVAKAYNALLRQAFKDIRDDPFRPGSKDRPDIAPGVRSYHIALSRERAASPVKSPRHLILYYQFKDDEIAVSRVLHDSRDLARHVPGADIERAREFRADRRSRSKEKGERER